jgi:hypothetical protein
MRTDELTLRRLINTPFQRGASEQQEQENRLKRFSFRHSLVHTPLKRGVNEKATRYMSTEYEP